MFVPGTFKLSTTHRIRVTVNSCSRGGSIGPEFPLSLLDHGNGEHSVIVAVARDKQERDAEAGLKAHQVNLPCASLKLRQDGSLQNDLIVTTAGELYERRLAGARMDRPSVFGHPLKLLIGRR